MRENSYWLPHTDRVLLVFCALSTFLMRLLAGWAGQLCAGDRAFCLAYEVNGWVGVRMGRRRKYLINAYTKSLHLNPDSFTHPIVFFPFLSLFPSQSWDSLFLFFESCLFWEIPFNGLYLQGKCCWCLCAARLSATLQEHCLNVLHWVSQGPACPFSSCAFGTFVYFSCDLG